MWAIFPGALPAIDPGKSALFVLDGDRHGGPDGVAALHALLERNGCDLGSVPRVRTPGDGEHAYFQANGAPIVERAGRICRPASIVAGKAAT